jgi:hypothetical protein
MLMLMLIDRRERWEESKARTRSEVESRCTEGPCLSCLVLCCPVRSSKPRINRASAVQGKQRRGRYDIVGHRLPACNQASRPG